MYAFNAAAASSYRRASYCPIGFHPVSPGLNYIKHSIASSVW